MKIGVIIPTRGDRPRLLENCLRQLGTQTVQPDIIKVMDQKPVTLNKDITKRYREGYDALRNHSLDAIFFWEDDDYYSPEYIETMLGAWSDAGRPKIFGTNYTIYYNLRVNGYFTMHHPERSSAMSTLIKPDMDFEWCPDFEPFTDMHLWYKWFPIGEGAVFKPSKHICVGIKHGEGLCGGASHTDRLYRYSTGDGILDPNNAFLAENMTPESFEFYSNYFKNK